MSTVAIVTDEKFTVETPLLIIGAGAAGLCAALAATEASIEALVIERDAVPAGSTALSAGLIPAAGTRFQRAKGITDSPELFAADIQRKAKSNADQSIVEAVAHGASALVEWLADRYGLPFDVIDNFNYSGHSAMRMHGLPTRAGSELIDRLRSVAETSDISIIPEAVANTLLTEPGDRIRHVLLLPATSLDIEILTREPAGSPELGQASSLSSPRTPGNVGQRDR